MEWDVASREVGLEPSGVGWCRLCWADSGEMMQPREEEKSGKGRQKTEKTQRHDVKGKWMTAAQVCNWWPLSGLFWGLPIHVPFHGTLPTLFLAWAEGSFLLLVQGVCDLGNLFPPVATSCSCPQKYLLEVGWEMPQEEKTLLLKWNSACWDLMMLPYAFTEWQIIALCTC